MQEEFERDLAEARKNEADAETNFQNLKSAKLGEIKAATESKKAKEAKKADTQLKAANAKEDKESTTEALNADQAFLADMKVDCKEQDQEYNKRSKIRGEEVVALSETLKILTGDEARDLYAKTVSFMQLAGANSLSAKEERATDNAMKHLAKVARKHNNWALVSLAVRVRLDKFVKVKEAMDKMSAELAKQQKEEVEKRDFCNKELDTIEDNLKVASNAKEDLDSKHLGLVNTLEQLSNEIDALQKDESANMVSLKESGEQRKAQNMLFQQSVSDQRAAVNILHKAEKRLQMFYNPSLLQEPGQPSSPKPDAPKAYKKSAASGGVMQVLAKIISNAEAEEAELVTDERHQQKLYAEFVQATQASIEANRKAIAEKTALTATNNAAKSETEESQLANSEDLAKLAELLKAQHMDCDWILKYFDTRQQARQEEMDAIADAKAVLSGADFAKEE